MQAFRSLFFTAYSAEQNPAFMEDVTQRNFYRLFHVLVLDAGLRVLFIVLYMLGVFRVDILYVIVNAGALLLYAVIYAASWQKQYVWHTTTKQNMILLSIVIGNATGALLSFSGYETYLSVNAVLVASYLWASPLVMSGRILLCVLLGIHGALCITLGIEYYRFVQTWNNFLVLMVSNGLLFFLSQTRLKYLYQEYVYRQTIEQQNEEIEAMNTQLLHNNTHLQYANEQLTALNEEKTRMMNIVAHDLRNPLTGMMLSIELIEKAMYTLFEQSMIKPEKKVFDLLGKIQSQGLRVHNIVNELLDIHRMELQVIRLVPVDVIDVCTTIIDANIAIAESKRIVIHVHLPHLLGRQPVEVPDQTLVALADKRLLEHVLDNVLSNAIKFSPFDSHIDVFVSAQETHIRIAVHDWGPGLTDDDVAQLFTPFVTLSARPTNGESSQGIGLALCKQTMLKMNGNIYYEQTEGQGATFVIECLLSPSIISSVPPTIEAHAL